MMPGAAELVGTMRAHGAHCVLVSGGFTFFTGRVAERLGFHAHDSNTLLIEDGKLTGRVAEPILDRDAKLATLKRLAAEHGLPLAAALAVGDGANDLDMIRAAGLGVAFRAKPVVAAAARARVDHAGPARAALRAGLPGCGHFRLAGADQSTVTRPRRRAQATCGPRGPDRMRAGMNTGRKVRWIWICGCPAGRVPRSPVADEGRGAWQPQTTFKSTKPPPCVHACAHAVRTTRSACRLSPPARAGHRGLVGAGEAEM